MPPPPPSPDETPGEALFNIKGSQGQMWIPAHVRYVGTTDIKVNVGILYIAQICLIMQDLFAYNLFKYYVYLVCDCRDLWRD